MLASVCEALKPEHDEQRSRKAELRIMTRHMPCVSCKYDIEKLEQTNSNKRINLFNFINDEKRWQISLHLETLTGFSFADFVRRTRENA